MGRSGAAIAAGLRQLLRVYQLVQTFRQVVNRSDPNCIAAICRHQTVTTASIAEPQLLARWHAGRADAQLCGRERCPVVNREAFASTVHLNL